MAKLTSDLTWEKTVENDLAAARFALAILRGGSGGRREVVRYRFEPAGQSLSEGEVLNVLVRLPKPLELTGRVVEGMFAITATAIANPDSVAQHATRAREDAKFLAEQIRRMRGASGGPGTVLVEGGGVPVSGKVSDFLRAFDLFDIPGRSLSIDAPPPNSGHLAMVVARPVGTFRWMK